jgi:small subunit ribosomal protein S17
MAKKKQEEEITETPVEAVEETAVKSPVEAPVEAAAEEAVEAKAEAPAEIAAEPTTESGDERPAIKGDRGNRAQKVGTVKSDKMQKTCVVRVDRLVKHPKYRRYVRRRSNFMAHNEMGATTGDRVRIVETRPLSARKRWRVVEIIQKAEK